MLLYLLVEFQSTLPARGATSVFMPTATSTRRFQSTLPARGATYCIIARYVLVVISLHAPRERSDPYTHPHHPGGADFNPRSPRGERRPSHRRCGPRSNFNPRSPRGERPAQNPVLLPSVSFQST